MENKRIFVTGGGGFIGTNLVNELRNRGHEAIRLAREQIAAREVPRLEGVK